MWAVFRFHGFPWYIIDIIHAKASIQRIKNSNSALQKQELSTSKTVISHFKDRNSALQIHFFNTYCPISLCS